MGWFRRKAMQILLQLRHKKNSDRIRENLKQLHESEKMNTETLQRVQDERLSNLLTHAYRHVPYYRKAILASGVIDINENVDLNLFHSIPLLDKITIHSNMEAMKSDDIYQRQYIYNASGGSTGEPVSLIQDNNFTEWCTASKLLFDEWTNLTPGDKKILLWGSKRDLLVGRESLKAEIFKWLSHEYWLNAYQMTKQQMKMYVKKINSFKPLHILAYADSIDELSQFIEKQALEVHAPKSIITSAGTLFPEMRERIERVFLAPVFNRYGSREVGAIACECDRHEGLHVSVLTNYIEILRPDGTCSPPGEIGEIVVTSLVNYAMPLIRYRIGDLAAWSKKPCSCGRGWSLLMEVSGRVSDTFITNQGTRVNGKYFHHLFYFNDWVRRYQIIQEKIDYIRVLIVLSDSDAVEENYKGELKSIRNNIQSIMGDECLVDYEFLKDIPPTASGKHLYTISKVSNYEMKN